MSPGHDEDINTALSKPHTVNKMGTREASRPQDERPVFGVWWCITRIFGQRDHLWPLDVPWLQQP